MGPAPKVPFASDLNANFGDLGLTLLTQAYEEGVPLVVAMPASPRAVLEGARDLQAPPGRIGAWHQNCHLPVTLMPTLEILV